MSTYAILQDIQQLLDAPTTPANVPQNAVAYSLTKEELDDEIRDVLNKMDA